mmetsp:Transcript_7395/g.10586  ORF Transcript_7395/g.10586 Transcript_7395/m.10586 type:complete len:634 (-) Transcript_7395:232-2133(-)
MDGTYSNFSDYPLKEIPAPHAHDVLCGRGGGTNNHVGNNHWRALVAANKQLYITLPKRQKMLLSRSIVNAVRSQNPPGRFLQKDSSTSTWFDVGDHKATEKTSQALREGAPTIRGNMDSKETEKGAGEKGGSTEKATKTTTKKNKPKNPTKAPSIVPPFVPTNVNSGPPAATGAPASSNNSMPNNTAPPPPPQAPPQSHSPGMMHSPGMGSPMYPPYNMAPNNYPNMVRSMQHGMPPNAQGYPNHQGLPSHVPPPVSSQAPVDNKQTGRRKRLDPSVSTSESKDPTNGNQDASQPSPQPQSATNGSNQNSNHGPNTSSNGPPNVGAPAIQFPIKNFDAAAAAAAAATGAPEPVGGGLIKDPGYSFGSISMTSVEHQLLQPTGTSFGEQSQALASIASYEPDPIWEPAQFNPSNSNSDNMAPPPRFGTKSKNNLLECSDSEDEGTMGAPAPQSTQEWDKMQMKLGARIKSTDKFSAQGQAAPSMPPPNNVHTDGAVPTELGERDISCMSALSVMSFEPLNPSTSRSISKVIASMGGDPTVQATELGRDVSNAFSEMSLSRDGSDTIGTIDKQYFEQQHAPPREVMGPPANVVRNPQEKKDGGDVSEQEQLEMMYLQRGASLAFEPFGSANNQFR